MLKNILNLDGAQVLSNEQKKAINGGRIQCIVNGVCTQYGIQCAELACRLLPLID